MKTISGSITVVNEGLVKLGTRLAQRDYDDLSWHNPIQKFKAWRLLKAQMAWEKKVLGK